MFRTKINETAPKFATNPKASFGTVGLEVAAAVVVVVVVVVVGS